MKLFRIALIASLTAMTGSAIAATQGTIGNTSTGTSDININKGNAVQITDVDDIDLGTSGNLSATATQSDSVCVFSSTGAYNVTVTSSNGSFILTDTNTTTDIVYTVDWTVGTLAAVTYNTAITGLVADSTAIDCGATTNATFTVSVAAAAFNAADPGSYTDTLTLLVQPE